MQKGSNEDRARTLAHEMERSCVGVRVGRLHRLVAQAFERELKPIGVSLQQLEVLSILVNVREPMKQAEIAAIASVDRSTMSRNIGVLVERGWAQVANRSLTGRSLSVVITASGVAILGDASLAWAAAQDVLITRLGGEAISTLDRWVSALGPA